MKGSERWCCEGLKHAFSRRLERGMYVFAMPPTPEYNSPVSFWIGCRVVRQLDLGSLNFPTNTPPLTIATWLPIKFCPWCGVPLSGFYKARVDQLYDDKILSEMGMDIQK